MSPSLGGTYPGAERFQSTYKVDQQLLGSIPEAIQLSNLNETIDSIEDGDLRNPIAPPMTSTTGAMVIFNAGTADTGAIKELVLSDVRQTLSDTPSREESDTPVREIEGSAHTDINTNVTQSVVKIAKRTREDQG